MYDRSRWYVQKTSDTVVKELASALSISELTAKLLANRGYREPSTASAFIKKEGAFLHDPFLLKDIRPAAERILKAVKHEERIMVYGDYDVDGVTAVTVLYTYLRDLGALVDYYIPTRESEGYGVNKTAFNIIRNAGTKLVITVDTGITALEEIDFATSIGLDVVVTDHHKCRPELPKCVAVVNPQRPDCEYPFSELSGVGVAFKLVCALEMTEVNCGEYNLYTVKEMCRRYADFVTLGTIADVMPLFDENRILVHMGLHLLSRTKNPGLRALFQAIGIDITKGITSSTVSFNVAPKINAAGRIGNASRAVLLFLASSNRVAEPVAEELCAVNRERQQTENEILTEALAKIEAEHDLEKESILVVAGDHWHHGVIGIVASRITEEYGKPSILITFEGAEDGDGGIGKGSARSIKGVNLVEALADSEAYLEKYGGHELAAGLSVKRGDLEPFRARINRYVTGVLARRLSIPPAFTMDSEITEKDITEEMVNEISLLQPCGAGNPEPLFLLSEARIVELAEISAGKHTRLILRKGDKDIAAVAFGKNLLTEGFAAMDTVDAVCEMSINEFHGNRNVQLIIKDIDFSEQFYDLVGETEDRFEELRSNEEATAFPDEIPSRAEFTSLYTLLRKEGYRRGKQIRLMKLIAKQRDLSYLKLRIMLEVFHECGLCELEETDMGRFYIKLISQNEKKDLTAAPLMIKLLRNE